MFTATKRPHPCAAWCAGRLRGIVENRQLTAGSTLNVEVVSVRRVAHDPDNRGFTVECQHGRLYYLKVVGQVTP
jgi:hypothetical protein